MSELQVLSLIKRFDLSIVILSAMIFIAVYFLNKLPKLHYSKFMEYLPYLLGTVFYSVYLLIISGNFDYSSAISGGMTVGGIATIALCTSKADVFSGDKKRQKLLSALTIISGVENAKDNYDKILKINLLQPQDDVKGELKRIVSENSSANESQIDTTVELIYFTLIDDDLTK